MLVASLVAPAAAWAQHTTLTIGVASFPSSLHPSVDPDVVKFYTLGFAQRPVTAFGPDRHLTCLFCTEIPSLENGGARMEGDGMAVTIHFKPGLTWADGAPFGAEDLAFTAQVGRDPNSGFTNTKDWTRISRVDVIDPVTAVMHFTEPFYQFDQLAELLPAHLEQPIYQAAHDPGGYIQRSLTTAIRPTPASITGHTASPRTIPAANSCWSATRIGAVNGPISIAS